MRLKSPATMRRYGTVRRQLLAQGDAGAGAYREPAGEVEAMNYPNMHLLQLDNDQLQVFAADRPTTELTTLARDMDAIAQRAAWLGTYFDRLSASDAPDDAAEYAKAQLKRVRKAMGYSYP